jgi:hypothetical protein
LQRRKQAGKPAPALDNMPELFDDLAYVWDGFWKLHRRRQYGFGPYPLAVRDIIELAQIYQVPKPGDFFDYISTMDDEWLKWYGDTKSSN